MDLQPVMRFPGSKFRLADWITEHLPPHQLYLEPFAGSLTVLMAKRRSPVEIVNDLDSRIVNFWRVLRDDSATLAEKIALTPWSREEYSFSKEPTDDPIEAARRFVVTCWQSRGMTVEGNAGWRLDTRANNCTAMVWERLPERIRLVARRLFGVQVEHGPALSIIERHQGTGVCLYCDPPYRLDTRTRALYRHELDDADHEALLEALQGHSGAVLLSSYPDPLYEARLADWQLLKAPANDQAHNEKEEWLWMNPLAARMSHQPHLPGLWDTASEPALSSNPS